MKTLVKWLVLGSAAAFLFFAYSCTKDNSSSSGNSAIPSGESRISVYMTDAPVSFYKVLIDIRQIAVEVDTATNQGSQDIPGQWADNYCGFGRRADNKSLIWDTLDITPGVYNLLDLQNGTDTLLGSGLYTSGKVLKIKITLGSADTVYTDSATYYPMVIFGPSPSFTINVQRDNVSSVTNNEFELWLDFNLNRSVFFWNGRFLLNPYIIVFNYQVSAKIKGQVLPPGASPLITAYNASDTLYAIPGWSGNYQFSNVPVGTYSINFKGHDGYQDTTVNGIVVDSMKQVQVPLVTLHK